MADDTSSQDDPSGIGARPQDDFVSEHLASPAERPARTLILSGLLGDSDRPGHRRLYFNKQLDYYAEFASADVISVQAIPADKPPFTGLEATKVTLRRDAVVRFTHVRSAAPVDEFDLDLRLGPPGRVPGALPGEPQTWEAECPGDTWDVCPTDFACGTDICPTGWTVCKPRTCNCTDNTCRTDCGQRTCETCRTCAGQNTCQTCQTCPGQATCQTCAGQNTCQTCQTCPGQATCQTCAGQNTCQTCDTCPGQNTCQTCDTCAGRTCLTCDTCNPHVNTCGPRCSG
jgi:hypothetical protein